MTPVWKRLTFFSGAEVLINMALIESVRPDPEGTRLYAPGATRNESYLVKEPFELVCAMLTEQPDEPTREQST